MKKAFIRLLSKLFNWYFDFYIGGNKRPVFFTAKEICPELLQLDKNYAVIKSELENLRKKIELKTYHDIDPLQHKISGTVNPEKNWKVYMLYMMGEFSAQAQETCPQTCLLLKNIPSTYQCFFSVLDGGKNIPPHNGSYRGYLRYHLGLKVPKENPPIFRIKVYEYVWEEAKSILFDDSWNHEVINNCTEERIVLVVDIYRPMPKVPTIVNKFITKHLIHRFYAKKILSNENK
jgi:aspartyl/asparaginyl beta-hydroxylase (cupin superfamily)